MGLCISFSKCICSVVSLLVYLNCLFRYCGSLEPMPMPAGNGGIAHALFVSKDRRTPKIRIQTRQLENLLDKRIIVAVDSWDRQSRYPSGHYVRTIGKIDDRDTETEVWNIGFCMLFLFVLILGKTMDEYVATSA